MRAILAIARNTFREAIRNKILYAIVFFTLLGLAFTLALGEMSVGEELRLVRDVGLGAISVFGVIVAIFTGVNLLYKELERRTVYSLIPKPIRRWQFVVGKFAGMAVTLIVLLAGLAAVLAVLLWHEGGRLDGPVLRAVVLEAFEVLVLCAVAVFFSSWTTPYLSGLFTLGVFALGRAGEDMAALAEKVPAGVARHGMEAVAAAVPNLYLFFPSGAEVQGKVVSTGGAFVGWDYVGGAAAYAAAYVAVALIAASLLFSRRDFL